MKTLEPSPRQRRTGPTVAGQPVADPARTQQHRHLSRRDGGNESSAIRDLLTHAQRPGMISLAGGLPDATQFPTNELAAIAHQVISEHGQTTLQYGVTQGDLAARHALASLFGSEADAEQLVITTGSQQALDLIARVMIDPGDQIVVGDPDYLGALQVFRSYGADIRPIALDRAGLDTAQLEDELRWGLRPKCCYLVPNFHNPTGASMSAERRSHLNALSAQYGFVVIEDDPYRELYYEGGPPTDVQGDLELTVQLRSTSKMLAPGLRVGALRGPRWLTDPIVTAKQSVDLHTSSLSQAVAAQALQSPWLDDHLANLRTVYGAKRDALASSLVGTFGGQVSFDLPAGGMFIWARFEGIRDTAEWLERCLEEGVCFVPGTAFGVTRDLGRHARLSFATGSIDDLGQAVQRMHRAATR